MRACLQGHALQKIVLGGDLRFDDNGKIVEHWDAIQKVPEKQAHNNSMF